MLRQRAAYQHVAGLKFSQLFHSTWAIESEWRVSTVRVNSRNDFQYVHCLRILTVADCFKKLCCNSLNAFGYFGLSILRIRRSVGRLPATVGRTSTISVSRSRPAAVELQRGGSWRGRAANIWCERKKSHNQMAAYSTVYNLFVCVCVINVTLNVSSRWFFTQYLQKLPMQRYIEHHWNLIWRRMNVFLCCARVAVVTCISGSWTNELESDRISFFEKCSMLIEEEAPHVEMKWHGRIIRLLTLLGHTRLKIKKSIHVAWKMLPWCLLSLFLGKKMVTSVKGARFQRNVFMSVLSLSSKSNLIHNFSHVFTSLRRYDIHMIALKWIEVWMCRMIASCCKDFDVLCQNTLWKATSWGTVFGYPEITRQPTENEIKLRSLTPRSTAYKGWPGSADFVALCPH